MRATAIPIPAGPPTRDEVERIVAALEKAASETDELAIRISRARREGTTDELAALVGSLERAEGWVETLASDLRSARESIGVHDG